MEERGRSLAGAAAVIIQVVIIIIGIGVVLLGVGAILLLVSSNVDARLADEFGAGKVPSKAAILLLIGSTAALLAAVGAMLHRLRRVALTVRRGEPFDPRNPRDLRIIALLLVLTEIGSTAIAFAVPTQWGGGDPFSDVDLTSWFAALIILVLAEVFREGARLRADAELTV